MRIVRSISFFSKPSGQVNLPSIVGQPDLPDPGIENGLPNGD
jgi:hypothetical protein